MYKTFQTGGVIAILLLVVMVVACSSLPGALEPDAGSPVQAQPPATIDAVSATPVVIQVERSV